MKKDWELKTLGEVCDVINGGTPKTGIPEYWDGNRRWITPAEMGKRTSPYVSDTGRKITDLGLRDSSAQMLPPNSVILSSRAPIGYLVINTEPMATNQGCKGLIPRKEIEHKFVYYYLSSIVDLLNSLGTGATFKELSGGKLKEITLPVPSLAEQQRIVGLLDEALESLVTAKANAEKNLQNARALFESHLQSVFTQRGPGWVERTLGDVCDATQGVQLSKSEQFPTKLPGYRRYLYISDFESEKNLKYVRDEHPKKLVTPDDIIVANTGSAGKIFRGIDGILSNNLFKVSFDPATVDRDFIFFFVTSGLFREYQQSIMRGTANPHMGHVNFKSTPICIPGIETQKVVVEHIHEFANETQRLARLYERKLAALEVLKKSLLHQAFSGEL
jgi:type I restriction enzyme, S subunit